MKCEDAYAERTQCKHNSQGRAQLQPVMKRELNATFRMMSSMIMSNKILLMIILIVTLEIMQDVAECHAAKGR
jgi:hypothetical protein